MHVVHDIRRQASQALLRLRVRALAVFKSVLHVGYRNKSGQYVSDN
jgi:hypothetical protein